MQLIGGQFVEVFVKNPGSAASHQWYIFITLSACLLCEHSLDCIYKDCWLRGWSKLQYQCLFFGLTHEPNQGGIWRIRETQLVYVNKFCDAFPPATLPYVALKASRCLMYEFPKIVYKMNTSPVNRPRGRRNRSIKNVLAMP